jgi:hypothetical protein
LLSFVHLFAAILSVQGVMGVFVKSVCPVIWLKGQTVIF